MIFQFDSVIAEKHGINEAVFIHNIFYWINHNKANNKHYYEDRFWTYNTKKAFIKLFPFWSYEQVRKIVKNLSTNGVILTGNFNENTWDKTTWYSLSDEMVSYYENLLNPNKNASVKNHTSNCEKPHIELGNNTHRTVKNHTSYIGTDNKTHIIKPDVLQKIVFSENSCFEYFIKTAPERYEIEMMKLLSKIKDFQRFVSNFECVYIEEQKPFDVNVIEARMRRFANNWNDKEDSKVIDLHKKEDNQPAYMAHRIK